MKDLQTRLNQEVLELFVVCSQLPTCAFHCEMLDGTARILPLPTEVASQIKSSTAISSLDHAVIGLVENSLDAGGLKIDISVDFLRGACTVEDDGHGIAPGEFLDNGGLGKPYREPHSSLLRYFQLLTYLDTSKQESPGQVHGQNGTFLPSLAALSVLTITSHHHAHRSHATLIVHHSRPAARLVPASSHHQLSNREHGTRVIVQDLFGNMPVRVKQRGMTFDAAGEDEKQMELLRKRIIGVLLAWDAPVMLTLRSIGSTKKLIIRGKGPTSGSYDLSLTCSILSQASYIDPTDWGTWVKTSARTPFITIQGAISLQPTPSKQIQFIALGVHHVDSRSSGNVLYDEVNRLFASSSFGKREDVPDARELERRSKDRRFKQDGHTNKQLKGGGKWVDRWPKFSLRIDLHDGTGLPRNDTCTALEKESTLSGLLKVLGALIDGFLDDHHFRPRSRRTRKYSKASNGPSISQTSDALRFSPLQNLQGADMTALPSDKSTEAITLSASMSGENANASLERSSQKRKKHVRQGSSINVDDFGSSVKLPSFSRPGNIRAGEWFSGLSRIKSGKQKSTYDELFGSKPAVKPRWHTSCGTGDHAGISAEISSDEDEKCYTEMAKKLQTGEDYSSDILQCGFDVPALDDLFVENESPRRKKASTELEAPGVTPDTEQMLTWVNPITKGTLLINARTGLVVPQQPRRPLCASNTVCSQSPSTPCSTHAITLRTQKRLTRSTSAVFLTPTRGSWVGDFLKSWDNPVFKPTEESIPQVSFDCPTVQDTDVLHDRRRHVSYTDIQKVFTRASSSFATKISKESLSSAKVIAQVDKKFILVRMDSSSATNDGVHPYSKVEQLIVLIDQHAADERIRVEELLAQFCTAPGPEIRSIRSSLNQTSAVDTTLLQKPITFHIQAQEHRLFTTHCAYFAAWGILFDLSGSPAGATIESSTCSLLIRTLPAAIAERCRTDPKILIEMLRGEIWKREELGTKSKVPDLSTSSLSSCTRPPWLSKITSCPAVILDMLSSRSCRSAIMFNDVLTHDECSNLIAKLAKCVFPFQCAHGRPSMVPLMGLGSGEGSGVRVSRHDQDKTTRGFAEEWNRWTGKIEENGS